MFYRYLILFSLLLGCGTGYTQTSRHTEALIRAVREEYQRINQAKLVKKELRWETDTSCEAPPMGGTVTFFYENNNLVKILNDGGEDHGTWKEAYYFRGGKLFFVYENNAYGGAADPEAMKYQTRYYIDSDQVFNVIASSKENLKDKEAQARMIRDIYRLSTAKDSRTISRLMSCPE